MTVAFVLVFFVCQLADGQPFTREVCSWSSLPKAFETFEACQKEGWRRLALKQFEVERVANNAWVLCLPREDMKPGEDT